MSDSETKKYIIWGGFKVIKQSGPKDHEEFSRWNFADMSTPYIFVEKQQIYIGITDWDIDESGEWDSVEVGISLIDMLNTCFEYEDLQSREEFIDELEGLKISLKECLEKVETVMGAERKVTLTKKL